MAAHCCTHVWVEDAQLHVWRHGLVPQLRQQLQRACKTGTRLRVTRVRLETADRWGVAEGQLSLASKMINTQLINRVVRQYIDDEISASEAVAKMNEGLGGVE